MRRPRLIAAILRAALGVVLSSVGLVLLSRQAADYVETARWPEYSLLELINSPSVKLTLAGELLSWVYRPESLQGLHATMVGVLDVVPASLFFLGLGGLTIWKALR